MKRSRLWTGLASACSFLLTTSILGMNCMMSYEGTVNGALGITVSKVVNAEGTDAEDTIYYESEYGELNAENLQKLIADTYEHSVTEQGEGTVLLKNENDTLPLAEEEISVTLFGHAVVEPLYKASSAGSKGYEGEYCIDLYTALTDAGMKVNDILYNAYLNSDSQRGNGAYDVQEEVQNEWSLGEEDISFYTEELKASWEEEYNDAAIVMFAREGGEGSELYMEDPEGISQLALHQSEKDLLQMINDSGKFEKIIVLLNTGNAMEVGWLDEYGVDACLWIGLPGQRGFEGVAKILTGEINPSGHLVETYAVNSLSAPATVNGSYNNQNWTNVEEVVEKSSEAAEDVSWYTVQAEGIYIGYKYYETRYEDVILGQGNADSAKGSTTGKSWDYTQEVSYPFGFGMSYTEFEQSLDQVDVDDESITVTVTVRNTGDQAGKSAVQIYAQTPYGTYERENLVEKSAIQLLDFAKTDILEPGESQTLTIECEKYLLASYDYVKEKGYILSEGDYYISIGDDAHDALNNILAAKGASGMVAVSGESTEGNAQKTYCWTEEFDNETYNISSNTGVEVTNLFDECDINYWVEDAVTYLSRNNWDATYPVKATTVAATDEMIEELDGEKYQKAEDALSTDEFVQGDNKNIPLAAMIGLDYDAPEWEEYLNQFTAEDMTGLLKDSYMNNAVPEFGIPSMIVGDGPDGVGGIFSEELYGDGRNDCCFPCESIMAATFNKELMERRGELMGEEAMYLGMTHVWVLGSNLDRTPFGGRNFEYYSEDANMNYLCQIPEARGMNSKGVSAGLKHFAGNDQENNRMGVCCFFNEQAFREGALRGCEGSVRAGECTAVMHGFNRIGFIWCTTSKELCTNVLIDEWGFQGMQESDAIVDQPYQIHYTTTLMAGTDFYCFGFDGETSKKVLEEIDNNDNGDMLARLRTATKNHLYIIANSSVMNGYSIDSKVVSLTPWWQPVMYVVIGMFAVLDLFLVIMLVREKRKAKVRVEEVQK